jgi:hypothetical protein
VESVEIGHRPSMTGFSSEEKPVFSEKTRRFRAPEPKNHPLKGAMNLYNNPYASGEEFLH